MYISVCTSARGSPDSVMGITRGCESAHHGGTEVHRGNVRFRSRADYGLTGLTGSSLLVNSQIPPTTIKAPPAPTAMGEFRIPPDAPGEVPAAGFLRFFLELGCACESSCGMPSSRVVCCPWASRVAPLASLMVRSPLRAVICTVPSTSRTSNSVKPPRGRQHCNQARTCGHQL